MHVLDTSSSARSLARIIAISITQRRKRGHRPTKSLSNPSAGERTHEHWVQELNHGLPPATPSAPSSASWASILPVNVSWRWGLLTHRREWTYYLPHLPTAMAALSIHMPALLTSCPELTVSDSKACTTLHVIHWAGLLDKPCTSLNLLLSGFRKCATRSFLSLTKTWPPPNALWASCSPPRKQLQDTQIADQDTPLHAGKVKWVH